MTYGARLIVDLTGLYSGKAKSVFYEVKKFNWSCNRKSWRSKWYLIVTSKTIDKK